MPKRLVVIGGGYIGLELGMVYAKLGTQVTVVEALPAILPGMDQDCVKVVARKLKKLGVEVMLDAKAKSAGRADKGDRAVVTVDDRRQQDVTIDADKILVAVGRRPNTEGLGLDEVGVKVERGFVTVDHQLRTNVAGIYAIGDVAGQPMLAHKAPRRPRSSPRSSPATRPRWTSRTIPAVVFTDPEIASAGLTEERGQGSRPQGQGRQVPVRRARARDRQRHRRLRQGRSSTRRRRRSSASTSSATALRPHQRGRARHRDGRAGHDMQLTIHPHPTLTEAMMEAAKAAWARRSTSSNR